MLPENFEIANFWVVWLIPLPLLIYLLLPKFRMRSSSIALPYLEKAQEYTGKKLRRSAFIRRRNLLSWTGLMLVWLLLITAASSPQLVGKPEMKVKTSRNFLILADISFSMANSDWKIDGQKASRWEAVKDVMHDFILKREGDRMGLVFFASNSYVQAPFTPDLKTVDLMLEEADVGMAGQMTNIGKAIVKGIEMFREDSLDTKVMLLLTDGVDAGTDIMPLDAAEMAKKDSIIIYTIGIGDPAKANSDLDERTLEEIAELTGGQYFRAIDSERMAEIYKELDKLEPIEYEEEEYVPRTLLYHYPLGAAAALSIILMFLLISVDIIKLLAGKRKEARQ